MPTDLDTDLTERLRAGGQRVTTQRLLLRRTLEELDRHVTAEELRAAAADRLPGLSVPTVYATLELFERIGIVHRVYAGPDAVLWDPRTDEHHHLVCRCCGRVEDVDFEVPFGQVRSAAGPSGFAPERAELVVTGLCRECRPAEA